MCVKLLCIYTIESSLTLLYFLCLTKLRLILVLFFFPLFISSCHPFFMLVMMPRPFHPVAVQSYCITAKAGQDQGLSTSPIGGDVSIIFVWTNQLECAFILHEALWLDSSVWHAWIMLFLFAWITINWNKCENEISCSFHTIWKYL